ncbi:MAG: glycosyltransferase [Chloroflexota bacterium]
MAKQINVLNLSPRIPYPADDGGKIGIASSLAALRDAGFTSDFFFFTEDDSELKYIPNILEDYKLGDSTKIIYLIHSLKNTPSRILKSIATGKSIYLEKHFTGNIREFFKELVKERKYDAILCHHTSMAPIGLFIKSLTGIPATLRMHNIEHRIWTRYAENLPFYSPKRAYVAFQGAALKKEEIEIWKRMDANFPITLAELNAARDLAPGAHFVHSLSGVDTDRWDLPKAEKNPHELLLATTYRWPHNVDALKWFLDEVLPIVHAAEPRVKVTLLGKNAPTWLENYRDLGVNPVGYVEDIDPYFAKAAIYFAPLFVGAGIRIKILEAMAAGLPVVATPVSAEGNFAKEEDGLLVAATAEAFAAKLIALLKDYNRVRTLGEAARKYIVANHDTGRNMKIITDCLASLVR